MKILNIALISSTLLMSGAVAAKDYPHTKQPANADQYYGLYQNPSRAVAPPGAAFDRSGTRGRQGFGGSPFHPEGPGNVAD
ncbi:hypothetical protein RZS28_12010 [Methylocapsa polymorpha]|uniref:Uncharacterized protein n=1 Tax=Methylocapsa polymorpha TaxID=3080828 RepID=A0ABZ0HPK6_9HYPH|nr:hypothetical protein RZS28_12010 [Methylocapsa sp. RX1]